MSSPTLSERAEILMNDLNLDQAGLAKYAEVTKGAVNQWVKSSKPTATMNPAVAYRIADKSNYNPRWLILGVGEKTIAAKSGLTSEEQRVIDGFRLFDSSLKRSWLLVADAEIAEYKAKTEAA